MFWKCTNCGKFKDCSGLVPQCSDCYNEDDQPSFTEEDNELLNTEEEEE